MLIIRSVCELKKELSNLKGEIGFVPTMGALHNGHISLIEKSKTQNDYTVVSVFVNPTQFLPNEDFDKYPKNESNDIKICKNLEVDILFMPDKNEIYLENEPKILAPKNLANILEGAVRPGHFDGVCMILNKFFNLIKPKRAYFGKKDAQQIAVVENLVKTFFMNIEIIPCEIIREADGLALSSRNSYLDEEQKLYALKLSRSLLKAQNLINQGQVDTQMIKSEMKTILEPLKIDYIAFTNKNFQEISKIEINNTIILVAAVVGTTRLIDNIWI
ncbi:pantoate--beta-alanine ligase [Campylobacter sp. FMV-PI01]|uniref:Pantothenate synthetase n=1 Tax=Campylobacter portucalensis TaxID=2608384 RepID=A0A6L5WI03_9BACT|nr:pantoate--beta-alanine ligase [Campylobacter portucalensis]MSN95645.1 pantoate--beta-alanine ligase [Campylobacter portucalensis]